MRVLNYFEAEDIKVADLRTTPQEVARWMLARIEENGDLYQETAAQDIEHHFGSDFIYDNDKGNPAISPSVLAAFRKISEKTVVWERGERRWRKREPYDDPGRQQY